MKIGISGTHGVGKSTLAEDLCRSLSGYVVADEPYEVLAELGHEFAFPPSTDDLLTLTEYAARSLSDTAQPPCVIFDRTPLDYLAYLVALGADLATFAGATGLHAAFANLDALVVIPMTAEADRLLPPPSLPALRRAMNDALLTILYDDPFEAWSDTPIVELVAPLDKRLGQVLHAVRHMEANA